MKPDLEALILGALREGPMHGYGIVRKIRGDSEVLKAGEGQLYPVLHRMESDGLVDGSWEIQDGRPPRKLYTLTEKGSGQLERKRKEFKEFRAAVESLLGVDGLGSQS